MSSATAPTIHPSAVVSPDVEFGAGVVIGPGVIISDRVRIGSGTTIGPGTVIQGPTTIGSGNRIFGQASIGSDPQDLKYRGEETFLEIGDDNLIREFVTINRGTAGGGALTKVGSGNLLMTGVHIAHDCRVGNGVIMANAATLAGHVLIEDESTIGAFCGVHQFCRVGRHAFIGGYSVVTRDALPFIKTVGDRGDAKTYGINSIGLERKGFSTAAIDGLKQAYRTLFLRKLKLAEAIEQLRAAAPLSAEVEELLHFIESSERGFIR